MIESPPRRSTSARLALAAVLAGPACVRTLDLEAPPLGDAASALFVFEELGTSPKVRHVISTPVVGGEADLPPIAIASRDHVVWALAYDCPLAALETGAPGVVPLVAEPTAELGRPLDRPASVAYARIFGSSGTSWSDAEAEVPEALEDLYLALPPRDACAGFEVTRTISRPDLASPAHGVLGVRLDDTTAFVASTFGGGVFYSISRDAERAWTSLPRETPDLAGVQASDGALWLAGSRGELVHGDPTSGFTAAPTMEPPVGTAHLSLAGDPTRTPPELFALADDGIPRHFDGTTWRALQPVPLGDLRDDPIDHRPADVVWTAPGSALFWIEDVAEGRANVFVYEDGAFTREDRAPSDTRAITAVEGLGTVVGTARGELWALGGEDVAPLHDATTPAVAVTRLAPFGDGFLVGYANGELRAYRPGQGFCAVPWSLTTPIDGLVVLSSGRFVALSKSASTNVTGIVVDVAAPGTAGGCDGR
ncbi:hypothetical protein L6R52_30040 [Myxococcota bacterium]|nr:hypothetical protein [Myxococcota bacterium]